MKTSLAKPIDKIVRKGVGLARGLLSDHNPLVDAIADAMGVDRAEFLETARRGAGLTKEAPVVDKLSEEQYEVR